MENILELYSLPYDPEIPLICMDEKPYCLLSDVLKPLPMKEGRMKRIEYKYAKHGMCSIFVFTEPLAGWRATSVRETRTKIDWAEEVHKLLTVHYPDKKKVRLVLDNLNTHSIGSLYERYPADVARQLVKRLEIYYTPINGSWLNVAEIELSAMEQQCLKHRRIDNIDTLSQELASWHSNRNSRQKGVNWQFTTTDARIKLKSLYPEYIE